MLNPPTPTATIIAPQGPCPCGAGASFEHCCAPRLNGTLPARTAEQLMRSRYTAHVVCDVDYLLQTWRAADPAMADPAAIRQWAQQSDWRGLTIHCTVKGEADDDEGWVEFTAAYADKPAAAIDQAPAVLAVPPCPEQPCPKQPYPVQHHRENSYFIRQRGVWFYVDGETTQGDKPGRNTPCPCGSGKKFKRCCGA